MTRHRADIDGLRAIAVCSVILFHFKIFPDYVRGGFIGVDVFFVISGYLISSIIFRDIDLGRYSILDFYDRRVRRIFPALFAMFAGCFAAALLLYFPSEIQAVGRAITASVFFVSNLLFYRQSGYFDRGSESNPLLHTWSLSVEEQFYVLFPLLVVALRRCTDRQRFAVICMAAAASLIGALYAVQRDPGAAFYLTHFRAWELLLGSILALNPVAIRNARVADAVGFGGLLALGASFYLITTATPFPGASALAPCLATAAVIWAGTHRDNALTRLLSVSPVQFVGKISYSLYLWHWPVIVFFRLFREPDRFDKIAVVAISVALATLSWRFVERPFRVAHRWPARRTVSVSAACMLGIAACAMALPSLGDVIWRTPGAAIEVMNYAQVDESHMRSGECFFTSTPPGDLQAFTNRCLRLDATKKNVLILGDSHAAHLWTGLNARLHDINFLQATASGCKPVPGASRVDFCRNLMRYMFDEFIPAHRLDAVILSGRWTAGDIDLIAGVAGNLSARTRVIVSGPMVEYDQALPRLLAKALSSQIDPASFAASHRIAERAVIDSEMADTMKRRGIEYFSPYKAVCPDLCAVWATASVPMEFDNSHLTKEGSEFVAQRFPALFDGSALRSSLPERGGK